MTSASNVPFFPPIKTRTHEVCGAGAYMFAFALAARCGGPVLWIREGWDKHQINPVGFAGFVNPSEVMVCITQTQLDTLAIAEESLRSKAVSLVVMALNKPIGLTEGRRLQLAAQAGESTGLAIIPDGMGSNAAQTRWRCSPIFDADQRAEDSTLQSWELIKNKSGTLGAWHVLWDAASHRIVMVSPSGK
ncbi:hypothetical protein [Shimia sp. NS0008-38b]|uniref:ImuA family protein n=1 Tax=Shimia sp. NS0008-38b TaxID=3127653 RepID=UPI0033406FFB